MAEQDPHRIQSIDWAAIFPFTRIFRSFRIAIHLPKLLLTLLLVIGIFLAGTILDGLWGPAALKGSLDLYGPRGAAFVQDLEADKREIVKEMARDLTTQVLGYEGDDADKRRDRTRERFIARHGADFRSAYRDLRNRLIAYHDRQIEAAEDEDEELEARQKKQKEIDELNMGWMQIHAVFFQGYDNTIDPAGADALRPRRLPEDVRPVTTRQFRRALQSLERGFVAHVVGEFGEDMGLAPNRRRDQADDDEAEIEPDPVTTFFADYGHRASRAVRRAASMIEAEYAERIEAARTGLEEELADIDEEDEDARATARRQTERAVEDLEKERDERIEQLHAFHRDHFRGVFTTFMIPLRDAADRIVDLIPNPILAGQMPADAPFMARVTAAVEGLRNVFVEAPLWLMRAHSWFFIIFLPIVLALLAFIGGTMFRMTALHATRDERIPAMEAVRFTQGKFIWYFLAPIAPLLAVVIVGLMLMLGGFILFNAPLGEWLGTPLNIIGGALLFLALLGGFVMTIMLIGLAGGGGMLYPAVATEGTDAFDAVSRAYAYLLGRPWRWLLFNFVGLIYIAITFLFVTWVVGLTRDLSVYFVSSGVVSSIEVAGTPVNRFEAMAEGQWDALPTGAKVAAALVHVWLFLLGGIAVAYLINIFAAVQTQIYLLLRHSADGAEFDDVYVETDEPTPPGEPAGSGAAASGTEAEAGGSTPEKVEPATSEAGEASTESAGGGESTSTSQGTQPGGATAGGSGENTASSGGSGTQNEGDARSPDSSR